MTFQDKRIIGTDWIKVQEKRRLMHSKNEVEANNPEVIKKTEPKTEKK